ncbi:flagellar hook-length control protein FliK [Xenorhabdus sp. Reich]|uniref:Flagellar hook-length control protein FliK n=1 Tax=Xenorhabdus littoralis TaxID=2582835 RepID=A0ABU4SNP1_9GAMM|nr:flagellar hook-length control protein FliK [Xenorhabdus sp. Reich]MDX8000284.1 flagellar hook-length control protein FliK [Xenorhabdus sp. Reich]
MNLTLLPTDLKGTEKIQPTVNNSVIGDPSSQFGQLLNAETASMRKSSTQADKNSLKEERPAADKTAKGEWSQLQSVSDKTVVGNKLQAGVTQQEDAAEFAVLKDEDLLSAEALSAIIPLQIAGLINPPANSVVFAEDVDGLSENGKLENGELDGELLDSKNNAAHSLPGKSVKDIRLTNTDIAEHSNEDDSGEGSQISATPDKALSDKATDFNIHSALAPIAGKSIAGKVKTAINDKVESGNTFTKNSVSNSSKDLNLLQSAIQGAPALTATTVETGPIESPTVLPATPLLSVSQSSTGQFQLNSTAAPLLSAHLGSEEWQQQLNQHVLFFNRNGLQQAELRLHPQELGALHIRMSVEDNQAQMHFVSAHQNVRAALEAALPGLRHALAESGIQLAQSSVNSDAQGNWQQEHHTNSHFNNQTNDHANSHADTQSHSSIISTEIATSHSSAIRMTPQQLASTRGGVDTFA